MEEKMQGIRASDLVVGYEGKSVLKNVNFWVRPGQILTLIGPNGSGKSTLLKSITRQLKTIAGQVYLAEGTMDAYTDAALAKQKFLLHQSVQKIWQILKSVILYGWTEI